MTSQTRASTALAASGRAASAIRFSAAAASAANPVAPTVAASPLSVCKDFKAA